MKLKILICFSLFCYYCNAQFTTKGQLTNLIFGNLYGYTADPDNYPAVDYPTIFTDLVEGSEFSKKVKLLTYLEYQDGIPVLWRDSSLFRTDSFPYHTSIIKTLIEAWNVPINTSGSLPYADVDSSTLYYEYIHTAYNLGLLPHTTNLNPYNGLATTTTINYVAFMSNPANVTQPSNSELLDEDNYFGIGIYTPNTLSYNRGMELGVFSHYAKNSFNIPDIKMNLSFSHFYSTQMVETPEDFYPIKPMGRGWSHTYNAYVFKEDNANADGDDYFVIVWSDGTIHIYNDDENEYESIGVYDEFDEDSSSRLYITKKNQVRYKFQRLDSDRDIFYLTEIRDPNGNEINIDYENAEESDTKRIEEVESPSGKKLLFSYRSGTDLLEEVEDPIGRKLEFEYSSLFIGFYDTLVSFEDAKNNETTYQYNIDSSLQQHLLTRIDLPRGNEIRAEYNTNGKLSEYQINGDDPTIIDTDFDYDDEVTSTITSPIPSGGSFTQNYTFNENGLVTNYTSDTDNTTIDYPSSGVNVTLPSNSSSNGIDIEYTYDSRGNVTKIDKENGDVVEEFDYDSDNNLTEYKDPNGNITKFYYDSDENLIEVEDPLGNSSFFNYDSNGQLTSSTNQEGITVNYTYESDGAVSSILAPEGIESTFSYDGINRLLQRIDNGLVSNYSYDNNDNVTSFTNSGGYTTVYNYDANDNLVTITNASGINTAFTYDAEDRVIEEQFGSLIKYFDYGDEGYLEEYTKPSGIDIDYDYDNDGRLKETGTITDIDYNSRNLVDDITNVNGTIAFDYDNLNLVEEVNTVHGYDVEYEYKDSGHVDEITYPRINGVELEVNYSYDDKNRLFQVILLRNVGTDGEVVAEFEYKDDDRLQDIEYGNGVLQVNFYDNAGRLDNIFIVDDNVSEQIYKNILTLDTRGNILQESEEFRPIPPGYSTGSSTTTTSYNYDDNNHILNQGSSDYNVDDDGNTIGIETGTTLLYDVDDRLLSYSDLDNNYSYKYNPYGQRIEVNKNGTVTKYIRDVMRDNILIELDSSDNPKYYYIYTPSGMLIARMKPNGDLHYYHGDSRGSVIAMTDENVAVTHQYRYDDFGKLTTIFEPTDDENLFRYVGIYGVEYDLNDLYYMRARYYKPSIGRFLTEDPIWSTNLYPYADNNPISRIDPQGTASVEFNQCFDLETTRQNIADNALANIGSTSWNNNVKNGDFGIGSNKCNLFVYDIITNQQASPGKPFKLPFTKRYPPVAKDWANPNFDIPGWKIVNNPQPGDVVAQRRNYSDATGHVAIVTGRFESTGTLQGGTIGKSNFGFYCHPDFGGEYTYRRYYGH